MLAISNKKAFNAEVNALSPGLESIKLHKIKIDSQNLKIVYLFISDITVSSEDKIKLLDYLEKITPKVFKTIETDVSKIVADTELIVNEIYAFIKNNYPSVSMWVEKFDINVIEFGDKIRYCLSLAQDAKEYFENSNILSIINDHLFNSFCSTFQGEIAIKNIGERFIEDAHAVYIDASFDAKKRTFTVADVIPIDEKTPPTVATYIADATDVGAIVLAGTVTSVKEKETKTGKPFFIFEISDTTAKISGVYFTRSNTLDKIRQIAVGDDIILRGKMAFYGEKGLSLTIDKISRCKFPENFVAEELPLKNPPKTYSLITPTPASVVSVKNIFDDELSLSQEFLNTTFVSVDIETTGTNAFSDLITEIGAVKIVNGKITEQWTTLVNPKVKIPDNIVELTGITDEMVADKPSIEEVFPDFLAFCNGATIVGQNLIDFDAKFLQAVANKMHYKFDHQYEDTLFLAREFLPQLRRHRLNDIAEYFGVEFRHHRALSDALATAEVFLELKSMQNVKNNK